MKVDEYLLALLRGDTVAIQGCGLRVMLDQAREHRVLHLVRDAVRSGRLLLGVDDSSSVESHLAAVEMWQAVRFAEYESAAWAVVRLLDGIGCGTLAVKGWWSMFALHDVAAWRFASDIDLVVSPEWREKLPEIGWALGPSYGALNGAPEHPRVSDNWVFSHSGVNVDLHRNVLTFEAASMRHSRRIWEEYTEEGGPTWAGARIPCPELGLAQLAVNYCRDQYRWLYQMDDVRRAAQQEGLDWSRFQELVRVAGVERIVAASLNVVAETLAFDLPTGVARRSRLMAPWAGSNVVLRASAPSVKDMSRSYSLAVMASGSAADACRRLWWTYIPSRAELPYQLRLRGLESRRGYLSGYAALTRFRLRRYLRERRDVAAQDTGERAQERVDAADAGGRVVIEVSSPSLRQLAEAVGWSILVRCLLRATSLRTTLAVLDRIPARRASGVVTIPTERTFARAGACLGRQVARSQYLRRRGARSTLVIGVRPPGEAVEIDAHAWLDRLDEPPPYAALHRIER